MFEWIKARLRRRRIKQGLKDLSHETWHRQADEARQRRLEAQRRFEESTSSAIQAQQEFLERLAVEDDLRGVGRALFPKPRAEDGK